MQARRPFKPFGSTIGRTRADEPLPKTGTAFDDPNYNPWDSVAKELISGDSAAVDEAGRETINYINQRAKHLRSRVVWLRSKVNTARKQEEEVVKLNNWMHEPGAVPGKVESPAWHKLKQAALDGNMIFVDPENPDTDFEKFIDGDDPQVFLMQHDWSKALDISSTGDGDMQVRLPFDKCCFEFQLGPRRLLMLCTQEEDVSYFNIAISCDDGLWFVGTKYPLMEFTADYKRDTGNKQNFILDEVIALCICLDAEVLTTEVIRAPSKLNVARAKQGKVPVSNHHVVSLAHRHRTANPLPSVSDGSRIGKTRLHFRRGHWRHYVDHKTWIRWQLVGNPDMGYVMKEYRA